MCTFYGHGIDIVNLSEIIPPNSGSQPTQVPRAGISYWMYHSGLVGNSELPCTVIVINSRSHALVSWEIVKTRLVLVWLRSTPFNETAIAICARNLYAQLTLKHAFWNEFQSRVNLMRHSPKSKRITSPKGTSEWVCLSYTRKIYSRSAMQKCRSLSHGWGFQSISSHHCSLSTPKKVSAPVIPKRR